LNDPTTSRFILLVFVPERCGTHDLNFNKDDMLHEKKFIVRTILNYFEHFLVELRKLYDFDVPGLPNSSLAESQSPGFLNSS
jgi:hypothetical protein